MQLCFRLCLVQTIQTPCQVSMDTLQLSVALAGLVSLLDSSRKNWRYQRSERLILGQVGSGGSSPCSCVFGGISRLLKISTNPLHPKHDVKGFLSAWGRRVWEWAVCREEKSLSVLVWGYASSAPLSSPGSLLWRRSRDILAENCSSFKPHAVPFSSLPFNAAQKSSSAISIFLTVPGSVTNSACRLVSPSMLPVITL